MKSRGWTAPMIDEAVRKGRRFSAINKLDGADSAATRYIHPVTGQSVVVDDATGKVTHVGGPRVPVLMSAQVDPLVVLLRDVRVVGSEFCWPAEAAMEILTALTGLDRVILGIELWRFDEGANHPTVIGWSSFEVSSSLGWDERLVASLRSAQDDVRSHVGERQLWVAVTWSSERSSENNPLF